MSMDVSTCNLTVNSNENTIGPVHYYRFLTIYMCKYYDKYIKLFSKRARHSAPSILVLLIHPETLGLSCELSLSANSSRS